ncbi:hypothetical protein CFK37_10860 [Virgibacillus phasianinus]|uniref:CHY-type domain-containing protein n=1 Tax=Virgibacillus phasianinus TaxID=2017483 RepID=A0A220U3F2_9BACI|nr:CHY zinc finger protein [Virgibacillus phasianinus]ASK62617.1 hypothetical protein CFK37_10860 [Virgibacillus phasianinus]
MKVIGSIDHETRCKHYHTERDRIAIKFYCCGQYYPCYQCHAEHGCGNPEVWPKSMYNQQAVLCGACGTELTIQQYLDSGSVCPSCHASFNPGCSLHAHLYFENKHAT